MEPPSTFGSAAADFSLIESGAQSLQPLFESVDKNWGKARSDNANSTRGASPEQVNERAQSTLVGQFGVVDEKTDIKVRRPSNLSMSKSISCPDFSRLTESPKRKRISSKVEDPKQIKQRRDYHNRTERIRMAKIRNAIEELKKEMEDQGLKVHRERAQILTRAIAHFRFLQQQIREVQILNQTLMSRVQQYNNTSSPHLTQQSRSLDLGVLNPQPMMPEQPTCRMDDKPESMPRAESTMMNSPSSSLADVSLRTLDASGRRWGKRRYRSYNRE